MDGEGVNLADLKSKGGFVSATPVRKEVKWTRSVDGQKVTDKFVIHVRPMAYGDIERIYFQPEAEPRSKTALLLSESVLLGEDASERLSYVDAYQLAPSLANALSAAVNEVNAVKN